MYAVKSVGCMTTLIPCSFRSVMSADHAAKKQSICQHLNSVVANTALKNDVPKFVCFANLSKSEYML